MPLFFSLQGSGLRMKGLDADSLTDKEVSMGKKELKRLLASLTIAGLVSVGGGSLPAVHAGSG